MRNVETKPERMACMEIWGGNRPINRHFEAPGLEIFVSSVPYQDSAAGGDIYYLTSCASGRISRFLLADVSGHGEVASGLATKLRDLLRQNVNKISQDQFVSQMNVEFGQVSKQDGFATAAVATFFEPTKMLDISVAGHPFPIYYSTELDRWVYLDPAESDGDYENLPLGIIDETNYPGRRLETRLGDMFLIYSDALIEAAGTDGELLGIEGVLQILNSETKLAPADVIPLLYEEVGGLAEKNLQDDDSTMMLGVFTEAKVRVRDNLAAPFRLLNKARDNTQFRG